MSGGNKRSYTLEQASSFYLLLPLGKTGLNSISPVSVSFPLIQNLSPKIKLNLLSKFFTTSSDSKSTIEPFNQITQQTNTYSKSTKEILEKGVNMFKVNNKDTRTTSITSFWCLYC